MDASPCETCPDSSVKMLVEAETRGDALCFYEVTYCPKCGITLDRKLISERKIREAKT